MRDKGDGTAKSGQLLRFRHALSRLPVGFARFPSLAKGLAGRGDGLGRQTGGVLLGLLQAGTGSGQAEHPGQFHPDLEALVMLGA